MDRIQSSGQTPERVVSSQEEKVKVRKEDYVTILAVKGWHKFARASHFCFPPSSFVLRFFFSAPFSFLPSHSFASLRSLAGEMTLSTLTECWQINRGPSINYRFRNEHWTY
jgi:hypothetical protein